MNKLFVGTDRNIELPTGGYLYIHDQVPTLSEWHTPRYFDPKIHSIDLLNGMDYPRACDFIDALTASMPGGENTLTKEEAGVILLEALMSKPASLETMIEESRDPMREKARRMIRRLLLSPVLRKVLCGTPNFSFNANSANLARINRAELRSFDATFLGRILIGQFKGQVAVPAFGPYARESHVDLIEQGRLIAGVNTLDELPPRLQQRMLLIKDKVAAGATFEDAETMAKYAGLRPDFLREDNDYNRFISGAMGGGAGEEFGNGK